MLWVFCDQSTKVHPVPAEGMKVGAVGLATEIADGVVVDTWCDVFPMRNGSTEGFVFADKSTVVLDMVPEVINLAE